MVFPRCCAVVRPQHLQGPAVLMIRKKRAAQLDRLGARHSSRRRRNLAPASARRESTSNRVPRGARDADREDLLSPGGERQVSYRCSSSSPHPRSNHGHHAMHARPEGSDRFRARSPPHQPHQCNQPSELAAVCFPGANQNQPSCLP